MPLTEAGRAVLLGVVRQPPSSYVTLHEWDHDWGAYEDRRHGIFGRQLTNRIFLYEGRARVENPQPGWTEAHWVVWTGDGRPWLWSEPNMIGEGDEISVDLRRDVRLG